MSLLLGGILVYTYVRKPTPVVYAREEAPALVEETKIETKVVISWTPERIDKEIEEQATRFGVSADVMRGVIGCESMGSTTIQSHHILHGKREESFGLVQINLPSHPTVTRQEAEDPEFAIAFLAEHLAQGQGDLWTCYRMLY